MSMTKEQEDIYHETINGLMKKLEARDELITNLRTEISQLRGKIARLQEQSCEGLNDGSNH